MIIHKKSINIIYIFLFFGIFTLHFYQLSTQHWSGVLDQDLVIIYNSILLNSGIEQEYRDHPAFTTFLINSLVYKLVILFSDVPSQIDIILNSNKINETFQFYFNISRSINFFFNLLIIFLFNSLLKKIDLKRDLRFLFCLILFFSIGYLTTFFFIRSENLSLLCLLFAINFALSKKRDPILNLFISGIFFSFAMLAKIQIIFLSLYLIYLIPFINKNYESKMIKKHYLKNYFLFSFFLGFFFYFIFQLNIQEFPRFENNKYLDLIFFTLSLFIFLFYFYFFENFKKNIILFSSLLNRFIFLIITIFLFDKIGLLKVNDFILLRITNPLHYMTEFTGDMVNGALNFDYFLKKIFKVFSNYIFSVVELILIVSLILINLKKNNYLFVLFIIFLINSLSMSLRYEEVYHLYYIFIYLILFAESIRNLEKKLSLKFVYFALVIFFINSLNFFVVQENNFFSKTFNRENSMVKVCKEFVFKIPTDTYESVNYIKYWHQKFDDKNLKKICDEII